jgi:glyoxylase-like metal-dependent hydrolase (beta-lactamase superfamily II)
MKVASRRTKLTILRNELVAGCGISAKQESSNRKHSNGVAAETGAGKEEPMNTTTYPVNMAIKPAVKAFFDAETNTISYVVHDPSSKDCAVIDPVMDIDYAAGRIAFNSADAIIDYIRENGLQVEWLIETHAHADHLSAAPYIQQNLGGKIAIGEHIRQVQAVFGKVFNEGTEFRRDGSQFDRLFKDSDIYKIGSLPACVMHTPGHTPACMSHIIGDAAFAGDTLFMPDGGTARADFPGGDAGQLYRSIKKVLSLPSEMRLFMCHDYGPNGRDICWETTVGEERANNIHVRDGVTEDQFVAMRTARDKTLGTPKLMIPSIQVNIRAGNLPEAGEGGKAFLKVPINVL